jgi:hypothetical protein
MGRRRKKNKAATRMEIAAMPPTMPPTMAPVLELCPPTGIGVAVFEVELLGTEGPEGVSIVPGPSSGLTIKATRGCETVTREKRRETVLTASGIRFVKVPSVINLERVVSNLSKKKD